LIDIGNAHLKRGRLTEADTYFTQALHLAQLYKGKRNEARASLSLASLRSQQNRPDEVPPYVNAALAYYESGGYRKEASLAYLILGRAYDETGNYDAAEKAFQQQLQIAETVKDAEQIGYAHEGLGSVEGHRQNFPVALTHYDEKYKVCQSFNNKLSMGYAAVARASVLVQLGRAGEARAALAEAQPIAENAGKDPNKELLALVHLNLAELWMTERKFSEAIKEVETALSLAQSEYQLIRVRGKSIRGLARASSGQGAAGRKDCEEAVNEARSMKDPYLLSQALLALAEAALNAGDADAALSTASEAQQRFGGAGQRESAWRAAVTASLAAKRLGDSTKSHDLTAQANEILSSVAQAWGASSYSQYLQRPDIEDLRNRIAG
jgi:tetratricopeptide (TPR) repeat protein